jgi:hypothetical protein
MLDRLKKEFLEAAVHSGNAPQPDIEKSHIIHLDYVVVVLGVLETYERNNALKTVDRYLDDVLALRRVYTPAKASDIYLIMAAPLDSANNSNWEMLAAEIERDDRLARKHIWLPNGEGNNFSEIVETTFLAKPWNTPAEDIKMLALLNQGVDVPTGWADVLLDPTLEGLKLVEKLVALEDTSTP